MRHQKQEIEQLRGEVMRKEAAAARLQEAGENSWSCKT